MDLDKRIDLLEKKIDTIMKAQEKFYPLYLKKFDELTKAFHKLNETASGMGNLGNSLLGVIQSDEVMNAFKNLDISVKQPKEEKELDQVV